MQKNRFLFVFFMLCVLSFNLKAQINERRYKWYGKGYADSLRNANTQKCDSIISSADLIFEGTTVDRELVSGGTWYLFQIEKVYRGHDKLKYGTIKVFDPNPKSYFDGAEFCFAANGEKTVVFSKATEADGGTFTYIIQNPIRAKAIGSISVSSKEKQEMIGLYHLHFNYFWQMRHFISKYPNISIKSVKPEKERKLKMTNAQSDQNRKEYFRMQDSKLIT